MAESGNDIVEFTQDGSTRWAARDSKAYQRYLKEQKQTHAQPAPDQAASPPPAQQAPQTEQPPQAQAGGKPKA